MPRIDIEDTRKRRRWGCPECRSTNWRANNGSFRCRNCNTKTGRLLDKRTGETYTRDEIEFVGAHASWKAPYKVGD
jgi:ribosomal protein L37AE/L43A